MKETETEIEREKDPFFNKYILLLFFFFSLMLSDNVCANCHQSFATNEQIVNAAGHIWHTHCFVYVISYCSYKITNLL